MKIITIDYAFVLICLANSCITTFIIYLQVYYIYVYIYIYIYIYIKDHTDWFFLKSANHIYFNLIIVCCKTSEKRRFKGIPYFQIIPFLVKLFNSKAIFGVLDDTVTKHWQLKLVVGTLVSTRGHYSFDWNRFDWKRFVIKIKDLSLFFFPFWKKNSYTHSEFIPSSLWCMILLMK